MANKTLSSHGRDSKLYVWQLRAEDEATFSTTLPIDDAVSDRKQPWLIHSLTVNTLNFCSFAMCADRTQSHSTDILIATPGVSDGSTNITTLPSEDRFATIPSPPGLKTGMTMALALIHTAERSSLRLLAGYESGHIAVWKRESNTATTRWTAIYTTKQHSQPILSLAPTPDGSCFFTSSADAIVARYSMPEAGGACEEKVLQTKHAGQQSISVRSDGKIFSTAGWDGRIRVYSVKTLKELAVLKWHKEGCYATAFARTHESAATDDAGGKAEEEGDLVKRDLTVSEQRVEKARRTHWLAAGSKDGKVSLWDIY